MSIEAMKQALDALDYEAIAHNDPQTWGEQRAALRTAIEQAEKQPTKLFGPGLEELLNSAGFYRGEKQEQCREHGECFGGKCIYTTPPAAQREWVGLTDTQVYDLADTHLYDGGKNYGILNFYGAIEKALREKNHGMVK